MRNAAAVLAVLVLFSCRPARAESDVIWVPLSLVRSAVGPENRLALLGSLEEREQRGVNMRTTGITLTVIGTLLTGLGVGLFWTGFCFDSCHNSDSGAAAAAGIAMLVLGPLGTLTGIPLWAAGQTKVSRTRATRLSLSSTGFGLQF